MLAKRIATALVLMAILLPSLFWFPPLAWGIVSLAFLAVAAYEWSRLLDLPAGAPWIASGIVVAGVGYLLLRDPHWIGNGMTIVIKLVLAIGIVGFGMVAMAKFRLGLESRGKYDLKRLERVHEREALRHAEVPMVAYDADEAYCMTCGEAFDGRHPACPRCKTTH